MGGGGSKNQHPPPLEAAPSLPPIRSVHSTTDKNPFNPNTTVSLHPPSGIGGAGGSTSIGGTGLLPQPPPHLTIAKKPDIRRPSFEYASSYVGNPSAHSMSYPPPRNPGSTPAQGMRRERTGSNSLQPRKTSTLAPGTNSSLSNMQKRAISPATIKQDDSMDKTDSNFDVGSSVGRERARSQADRFYEQIGSNKSLQAQSSSSSSFNSYNDDSTNNLMRMMAELGDPPAKSGTYATPLYSFSDFAPGDGTPSFAVTVPFLRLEELKEPQPTRELKRTNSREKVIANTNHKPQQAQQPQQSQPQQRRQGPSILDEPLPGLIFVQKIKQFDNNKFRAYNSNLKKKQQKPEVFQATYTYEDVNSTKSLNSSNSLTLSSSDSSSPPQTPPTPTPQDYAKLPVFASLPHLRHNSPVPAPAFDQFEEELMNSLFPGSEPNSGILAR